MASRPRERYTTFLVALSPARGSGAPVYAVRMCSAAEALAAVADKATNGQGPVIVGSLSTRTAKAIALKPGETRRV
ncbi:hypothetical protein [Methylobacterium sp. J-067]|uniref:hypothetical protein n=1 Tax=Methylobacterium sp. J-067 TaxID=2836648 RepID=UPI001FB87BBC|nr:hypothetical protein [Methylobacterium sp. J-067]MCJ2027801.1 hypothetical protein [Methylobacterium sp. J-067]